MSSGLAGTMPVHLREYGTQAATDTAVFDRALAEDRVLISADTDFGTLLATRRVGRPSLILLRGIQERHPHRQGQLLGRLLARYKSELEAGVVLVVEAAACASGSFPSAEATFLYATATTHLHSSSLPVVFSSMPPRLS